MLTMAVSRLPALTSDVVSSTASMALFPVRRTFLGFMLQSAGITLRISHVSVLLARLNALNLAFLGNPLDIIHRGIRLFRVSQH